MADRHELSAATIERVDAEFAVANQAAARATLARVEAGDDDFIHQTLLDVVTGDLVALKRATWVAFHDWRNLVMSASYVEHDRAWARAHPPPPSPPAPPALPPQAEALRAAAEALRWAETWCADPIAGDVYIEHGDRAVELTAAPSGSRFGVVYHGLDGQPEEEEFAALAPLLAVVTRWLRDGRHPDLDG